MATVEDSWAFVPIGDPFPQFPVRVKGENNMYVALWYKHGKPVCGRAWNNGGVVECSFPYSGKELSGKRDLGGEIQILTYQGKFDDNKYWYEWMPFKERNQTHLKMVRCGNSAPILMNTNSGQTLLGNIDLSSEKASISWEGKEQVVMGGPIQDLMVICRNHRRPDKPSGEDQWVDVRIKDPFPAEAVRAAGRPLKMDDGTSVEHCVALWYKHGEPVMGRCWKQGLQVAASFGWGGKEFTGNVGSIQVLCYSTPAEMGFDYNWIPYREATAGGEWRPVFVKETAPCLIRTAAGHERLGQVHLTKEIATVGWAGKEETYLGPQVQNFLVLCRN